MWSYEGVFQTCFTLYIVLCQCFEYWTHDHQHCRLWLKFHAHHHSFNKFQSLDSVWCITLVPHALPYDWPRLHPSKQRCCWVAGLCAITEFCEWIDLTTLQIFWHKRTIHWRNGGAYLRSKILLCSTTQMFKSEMGTLPVSLEFWFWLYPLTLQSLICTNFIPLREWTWHHNASLQVCKRFNCAFWSRAHIFLPQVWQQWARFSPV